jgi:hypothetical protein
MRILILSIALFVTAAAVEITEDTWKGTLVDGDCKQANIEEVCFPSAASKRFALSIDGGVLLYFDDHGNELALDALQQTEAGGGAEATVVGKREGRLLKVESLRIGAP